MVLLVRARAFINMGKSDQILRIRIYYLILITFKAD